MNELPRPWGTLAWDGSVDGRAPLLLLHGTGCDTADWQGVRRHLPAALSLDFPAHGNSSLPAGPFTLETLAADVLALLEHLDLWGVWLAGHSLGGMVAWATARQAPARLAGLVLLEGWTRLAVVSRAFGPRHHLGGLDPRARAQVLAKATTTRRRVPEPLWKRFWTSVEEADGEEVLRATELPVVEVYGSLDASPGAAQLLAVPERENVTWVWLEQAGHYLPLERPREVARLLNEARGQ